MARSTKRVQKSNQNFIRQIRIFITKQPASKLFLIGSIIIGLFLIFGLAVTIAANVLMFDGFAANGAFQLMNPLRRLATGEAIGNDFNFFHGIGVPLMHLPFYYLFGQGLFGSEMARWLVSPGLFALTTFGFFYAFRRRWIFALIMTAFVTAAGMILIPFLVLPLTSLLGVRSAIPVLLVVLLLMQQNFKKPITTGIKTLSTITIYDVLAGLLLALSFIGGTEFGVAAILAFFITTLAYKTDRREAFKLRLLAAGRVFVLFLLWLLALLTLITRGTPFEPLRFALTEIPADQFWYFGVPPNNFLHLGNLWETFSTDSSLLVAWLVALVAAILVFFVHRLGNYRVVSQAFIFALLAGAFAMVSMLGYYHYSETSALGRMSLLVGSASFVILFAQWKQPLGFRFEFGKIQKKLNLSPTGFLQMLGVVFVISALVYGAVVVYLINKDYDLRKVAVKTKHFVLGNDTSMLGDEWHAVDDAVVPTIQADNWLAIADVSEGDFQHGVSSSLPKIIVDVGDKAAFLRPGQLVYFNKSGRQIIKQTEDRGNGRMAVTLQNKNVRFDPQFDGAPNKLIVAEDFNHDNAKVWSLYSGLLETEMGLSHPSDEGYDYIIHALGEKRRAEYVHDFQKTKPQFVLTLSKPYFRYEEWVQNAHWDFYSLLDQNYEVARETSIYVIWKKRDQPWSDAHTRTGQWQPLAVDAQRDRIDLPNVPFENVPDLEQYGQQQMKADQDRRIVAGREAQELDFLSESEYDQRLLDQEHMRRDYEVNRRENAGLETDKFEHQQWLKVVEADKQLKNDKNKKPSDTLHVPRPKRQVVLVKLKYEASHPLNSVPLFGKTNRYFIEPNNVYSRTPITLRPYAREITFPLVISEKNRDPYLRLNTYSLLPGKGDIKITDARWAPLDTSVANLKALTD